VNYAGGTTTIGDSWFVDNQADGGNGNTGASASVFANLGAGGAIFNFLGNFNSSGFGQLDASVVSVSGSTLSLNLAQGGVGGNGDGGAIANLLDAATTVDHSVITLNKARGGVGGAGLGGGAFNDAASSLGLTHCVVTLNRANGSPGIGGGVYTVGTLTFDSQTFIVFNFASTSGDNIGP